MSDPTPGLEPVLIKPLSESAFAAMLDEFHRIDDALGADAALNFIWPSRLQDVRVAMECAKTALRAERPFDGMAALATHFSLHHTNSWYIAIFLTVAARCRRLEAQFEEQATAAMPLVSWPVNSDSRIPAIDVHLEFCIKSDDKFDPRLLAAYAECSPQSPELQAMLSLIPAYFFLPEPVNVFPPLTIPGSPTYREPASSFWSDTEIELTANPGPTQFAEYHDVKLYLLPGLYGLLELSPGVFYGHGPIGFAATGDDRLIRQYNGKLFKDQSHFANNLTETIINQPVMVPILIAGTYYFHFIANTLQPIHDARDELPKVAIILPSADGFFDRIPRKVYEDAVDAIASPTQKQLWLPEGVYRLSTVFVPSEYQYLNVTLQERLAIKCSGQSAVAASGGPIIYISRRSQMQRAVLNNIELVEALATAFPQVQTVFLEDLTFSQQVVLFQSASMVIGPHGGGFTNILFCRPGTSIIEFQMPGIGTMYWHWAKLLGLDYVAYVPSDIDISTKSFRIDPSHLIRLVVKLMSYRTENLQIADCNNKN